MMNLRRIMIGVVTILFLQFSPASAADMNQEQWVNYMVKNMPTVFCQPGQFYIDCYELAKEECIDTASYATQGCIDNQLQQLPEIFTYKESRHWGAVIEKCVDQEYTQTHVDQKKDTQECREIK